jgi:hypothetical protein
MTDDVTCTVYTCRRDNAGSTKCIMCPVYKECDRIASESEDNRNAERIAALEHGAATLRDQLGSLGLDVAASAVLEQRIADLERMRDDLAQQLTSRLHQRDTRIRARGAYLRAGGARRTARGA